MATIDDVNASLLSISRQLGQWFQVVTTINKSIANTMPVSTASSSPVATGINTIATAASVAIAANTTRHGIMFHNPGGTTIFLYPTTISIAPTLASTGGAFALYGGGTLQFSPLNFPNVSCGWSAFGAGAAMPLTVVEFY